MMKDRCLVITLVSSFLFRSSHFWYLFFVIVGNEVTKIKVIFVYILQGKMGKTENHETRVTEIPKTKKRKYGMNETFV